MDTPWCNMALNHMKQVIKDVISCHFYSKDK